MKKAASARSTCRLNISIEMAGPLSRSATAASAASLRAPSSRLKRYVEIANTAAATRFGSVTRKSSRNEITNNVLSASHPKG